MAEKFIGHAARKPKNAPASAKMATNTTTLHRLGLALVLGVRVRVTVRVRAGVRARC